jgi:DNA-nicking Smr family endonuclease
VDDVPPSIKGLSSLTGLRDALAEQARVRREADLARLAQERLARAAAEEFNRAMHGVTPLPLADKLPPPAAHVQPLARQREQDERAVLEAAVSDEIDVESLLDTDDSLSYCAHGIGPDVLRKLRRGAWSIQAQVDLHGHRVDEARVALVDFLKRARKSGLRCVRVVHGKGLGSKDRMPVLKGKVRAWLIQREEVIAFCQARPADGGSGALIVLLQGAKPVG